MLTRIRNHKTSRWMAGLILAGVTLSFPVIFLTSIIPNQKPPNLAVVKRSIGKPSALKKTPDNPDNLIPGKRTYNIGQIPIKPEETYRNNPVPWAQNKQSTPVQRRSDPKNEPNIYLLARVIHAEARGEPLEGQVAVGAVLLNRLQDRRFPKTLWQIVFKHGEFCTVRDGQIWMTPSSKAIQAARLAVSGWDPTGGAVYFYNPAKTTSRWIWSRPVVNKIGNHFFAV